MKNALCPTNTSRGQYTVTYTLVEKCEPGKRPGAWEDGKKRVENGRRPKEEKKWGWNGVGWITKAMGT